MTGTLPFGIDFVVEQDLIPQGFVKHPNKEGYSITCPFCTKKGYTADRHHKYSVNIYKNTAHCFRCGEGHGILSLHAALNNISIEEAKKDLLDRWNGLPSDIRTDMSKALEVHQEIQARKLSPSPIEYRDEIYRKLLSQLSLSDRHHRDLLDRGLTEKDIEKGFYRSVPEIGFSTFAKNCFTNYDTWKYFKNHRDYGIPGFYDIRTDEPKLIRCLPGFFIPVKDREGRISHLQVRFDELPSDASEQQKDSWAKYKPFTSDYSNRNDGCSTTGCENIHYAGDWSKIPESCLLTEGILKANIASSLGGRIKGKNPIPILAVDGVNKVQNLCFELFQLKDAGLEKVILALDMDYREKPQVKEALERIEEIVKKTGLAYEQFTWKEGKGIDDYLKLVYEAREKSSK